MKEIKFEIPADCDVDKIEKQDGHIVVTFKEKERKLPKSWEEFCKIFPIKNGKEHYINTSSKILNRFKDDCIRNEYEDKNILPDRATAEAVLALCQLIQLRNAYNGDWVPDWDNPKENKWTIIFYQNKTDIDVANNLSHILYFKSQDLRNEFLRCFRQLIEKLKPLYGIKEGGEE